MIQKTLGGDRLGAGKKQKVYLHNFERSTHDLSYIWRSTMSAGTLVPFMCQVALPGDTFDIDLQCDLKSHPTIGPLFGSYKVQLDAFQIPIRLYHALLQNNTLGIGLDMAQIHLPQIEMHVGLTDETKIKDLDNAHTNPSSLLAYLGLRGFGVNTGTATTRRFNAIPLLAYWDIYKNYYANKQEEIGAHIATIVQAATSPITTVEIGTSTLPANAMTDPVIVEGNTMITVTTTSKLDPKSLMFETLEHGRLSFLELVQGYTNDNLETKGAFFFDKWGVTTFLYWEYANTLEPITSPPTVQIFELKALDDMRENLMTHITRGAAKVYSGANTQRPYSTIFPSTNGNPNLYSQNGLGLKTYQSDLFNNWLSTEWIDGAGGISEVTAISTVGDSFTIDTLNLSKKVYNMLNRIAVSGGSYDDWLDAVYSHQRYKQANSPIYLGGLIKELVFQEVVSNAGSGTDPLGTLAGRGVLSNKHKGGKIVAKIDEPSYIMGIISLTPRIDYSQGNAWDLGLQTIDDLHKPDLDQIGFQDLVTEQMAWFDTIHNGTTWVQKSAGKQPAWINYMTNVNVTRGNFAIPNNQMFMTLNRRYEGTVTGGIEDLTTYIDPAKFNFIFAQTALDAQNFWAQIAVNITARRKMSAKVMPNL